MFEGDSADTCAEKFPLVPMGGWAEGPACADTGARTPIGASLNFILFFLRLKILVKHELKFIWYSITQRQNNFF